MPRIADSRSLFLFSQNPIPPRQRSCPTRLPFPSHLTKRKLSNCHNAPPLLTASVHFFPSNRTRPELLIHPVHYWISFKMPDHESSSRFFPCHHVAGYLKKHLENPWTQHDCPSPVTQIVCAAPRPPSPPHPSHRPWTQICCAALPSKISEAPYGMTPPLRYYSWWKCEMKRVLSVWMSF